METPWKVGERVEVRRADHDWKPGTITRVGDVSIDVRADGDKYDHMLVRDPLPYCLGLEQRLRRLGCAVCGDALGKSGLCLNCEGKRMEQELLELKARVDYPTCAECGASMIHGRLTGYVCGLNARHNGIVWPKGDFRASQTCRECGAVMASYEDGYQCSRNPRHHGIVWPNATRVSDTPTCAICGGVLVYSERNGYYCPANDRHSGIVWPNAKR